MGAPTLVLGGVHTPRQYAALTNLGEASWKSGDRKFIGWLIGLATTMFAIAGVGYWLSHT